LLQEVDQGTRGSYERSFSEKVKALAVRSESRYLVVVMKGIAVS
jgi:hypothetical protein